MSLQNQLNRFNEQQKRCQSTLSSIASVSRAGPSRPIGQKPTACGKFSENTALLQSINRISKLPAGGQVKTVIGLLFETRHALTPKQIYEACYVDMNANKAVFDILRNNPKVHYDGTRFSYKATHNVKDKNQLLSLIKKYPDGIETKDLKDAYPAVLEDLQALKVEGRIWLLPSTDAKEDIAYPNDFKLKIEVDHEFKTLFRDIDIPGDMIDVEKEMQKIGLKPATNTAKRRAAAQINLMPNKPKHKTKRKEISKRTKLTNAHLPELFQILNANSSRN